VIEEKRREKGGRRKKKGRPWRNKRGARYRKGKALLLQSSREECSPMESREEAGAGGQVMIQIPGAGKRNSLLHTKRVGGKKKNVAK